MAKQPPPKEVLPTPKPPTSVMSKPPPCLKCAETGFITREVEEDGNSRKLRLICPDCLGAKVLPPPPPVAAPHGEVTLMGVVKWGDKYRAVELTMAADDPRLEPLRFMDRAASVNNWLVAHNQVAIELRRRHLKRGMGDAKPKAAGA